MRNKREVSLYLDELIELIDCVRVSREIGTYKEDTDGLEIINQLEETLEGALYRNTK